MNITTHLTQGPSIDFSSGDYAAYTAGETFPVPYQTAVGSITDSPKKGEDFPTSVSYAYYTTTAVMADSLFDNQLMYTVGVSTSMATYNAVLTNVKPFRTTIASVSCTCETDQNCNSCSCTWGYTDSSGHRVDGYGSSGSCMIAGCNYVGGFYSGSVCSIYQRLSSICFKVSYSSNRYQLSTALGTNDLGGCAWDTTSGTLSPYTYTTVTSTTGTFIMSTVPLTVRWTDDPLIAYSYLTQGSDFGLTLAQKREIGLGLLIAGFLWSSLLIAIVVGIAKCYTRNRIQTKTMATTTITGVPLEPTTLGQPVPQQSGYAPQQNYTQGSQGYPQGYAQPQQGYAQQAFPQQGYAQQG